jgi:acyl-CoA synthetase (AMP-forming)/AMP-acid ligase II
MNLAGLLHAAARRVPQATTVAVGERALHSYRSWAARVVAVAAHLRQALGPLPGDRVALAMSNCPAFYEVLFAAWHAGMTAVPINAKLHPQEVRYILAHSGSRVCFCTPELHAALDALRAELPTSSALADVATDAYARRTADVAGRVADPRVKSPAACARGPRNNRLNARRAAGFPGEEVSGRDLVRFGIGDRRRRGLGARLRRRPAVDLDARRGGLARRCGGNACLVDRTRRGRVRLQSAARAPAPGLQALAEGLSSDPAAGVAHRA